MILGIETSCDETAVALFDPAAGLRGDWVASQVDLHAAYGGVVPELASREHLVHLPVLLRAAWDVVPAERVTCVAVTAEPGLAPCLVLGMAAARALGAALGVPVVPVNHLEAHVVSPFLAVHAAEPAAFRERFAALVPHLALLVSGGHTQLVEVTAGWPPRLRVVAATVDDAAGEALDKGAKLMGLGYPGGPRVEREAAGGRPGAFRFPRPLPERADRRFSFSGLKTSLRYLVDELGPERVRAERADVCASYQEAVLEALVRKTAEALDDAPVPYASLGLSGGVANNRRLRALVGALAAERGVQVLCAEPRHCGDNAAMIAFRAWSGP